MLLQRVTTQSTRGGRLYVRRANEATCTNESGNCRSNSQATEVNQANGRQHVILFEGPGRRRQGGTIKPVHGTPSIRAAPAVVALEKPTERRPAGYFNTYVGFPAAGEIVMFDRSGTTALGSNGDEFSAVPGGTTSSLRGAALRTRSTAASATVKGFEGRCHSRAAHPGSPSAWSTRCGN